MEKQMSTLEKLTPLIREFELVPSTGTLLDPDRSLDSFGFDSLDVVMLTMVIEDDFEISLSDPDIEACKTVGDLVILIEKELEKC